MIGILCLKLQIYLTHFVERDTFIGLSKKAALNRLYETTIILIFPLMQGKIEYAKLQNST